MNVNWNEARQIASDIVEKLEIDLTSEIGHDKFDALTSAIFDRRDTHWSEREQKWFPNQATTQQHVAELQDESEELHRKLKGFRDRCDFLERELARLKTTDQLVKDSENLRHIVNKLDSLNVPTQVEGEPLVLPVDRLAYLLSLMRKARETAEEQSDLFSLRVTELSIQLGTALRQRDLLSKNLAAALDAVEAVNERLRTATACKCQMIEVRAGEFQLFQVIDCPVHRTTVEIIA